MDRVARYDIAGHGPKHFCTLDYAMQRELRACRIPRCEQHGVVGHVSPVPSHGCVPGYPGYRPELYGEAA